MTISDTRTESDDHSGGKIIEALRGAGHEVPLYRIVKDDPSEIRDAMREAAATKSIQAVLINGGTGIASRDTTFETISALLEKKLDGFGEIFRMLSYQEIGAAAMLSRAVGGIYAGMVVFSMPGSRGAVELAMEKLILPELGHAVGELER